MKNFQMLQRLKDGYIDWKVKVSSKTDSGCLWEAFNRINAELRDREKLHDALMLAREVQQNFLPREGMRLDGIDIAGESIFCDEVGGDYYDFIAMGEGSRQRIGIMVGDVAGHGIPSALLMATVRSAIRQRSLLPGSPRGIVSDVNRLLAHDVVNSGQFMTLFYLRIDPGSRTVEWVRAGHDPALFYDPAGDCFETLKGSGIPLGVNGDWVFEECVKYGLSPGQVIFLATDGLWEARNPRGEMFGKASVREIIRRHAGSDATAICDRILECLTEFRNGAPVEDDVTLVVVKFDP